MFCRFLRIEWLAIRIVIAKSILVVVAWWLLVAVCLGQQVVTGYQGSSASGRDSAPVFSGTAFSGSAFSGPAFSDEIAPIAVAPFQNAPSPDLTAGEMTASPAPQSTDLDELIPYSEPGVIQSPEVSFPSSPEVCCYSWQVLPDGLLYRSYLAGYKESRLQWLMLQDTHNRESVWEATLGGRAGLLRYGTFGPVNPQAFQLDLEGAVFARVLPEEPSSMLAGSDYKIGLQGTWRFDRLAYKAGYYHISSHVGDEFLQANPLFVRENYVRDSLIAGATYDLTPSTQIYGEIANAIGKLGGAEPWEFQLGAQWTPEAYNPKHGAPFVAANYHLREDFGWVESTNLVAGWGWKGPNSGKRLRLGLQYYTGPSQQYIFLDRRETLIGGGIWYDF